MGVSDHSDSENETNEVQHSSLLEAVSQLDNKQRVKPPSRKESSYHVSEFHLTKGNSEKRDVHVKNLAKVLDQRASLAKIGKKLRSVQRKAKTLPTPLEKPVAARIQRSVGFENVKKQLGRWNAVVEANRAADQLTFPLIQPTIQFETTNDFVEKLKSQTRTPLEAAMDEVLNKSPIVQQERKEEEEYRLTLAEMRERRMELAKLRAQQSYMAAKASRQKKIKSKTYHRIQRRERIKQQLKAFETLQKVDPEAALKQLEELERTRAEERVSLRHRNTGQWARSKAVRAKYDKESRQELAQQLAVSRDLTHKVKTEDSSDEEEEDEVNKETASTDIENPWIASKSTSEVEEFVSGYRKFWEEQNKKLSNKINDKEKSKAEIKENVTNIENSQLQEHYERTISAEDGSVENKFLKNDSSEFAIEKDSSANDIAKSTSKTSNEKSKLSAGNNKPVRKKKISNAKASSLISEKNNKKSVLVATTDAWVVSSLDYQEQNTNQLDVNIPATEIHELFDNMERRLKKRVKTKLKRVRETLANENIKTSDRKPESEDESPSLKIKKNVVRANLDEGLNEESHNASSHNDSLHTHGKELIAQSKICDDEPNSSTSYNIDPNKFIAMKPKHLKTELPDLITGGYEGIDDEDNDNDDDDAAAAEERQRTITEAFAEDDVVAEFRKEKEEAEEKSQPENVDLTLPGWGEWGGKNLPVSNRKKHRFITKFPKVPPRKDANKGPVIVNEEKNDKVKNHQVSELPFPFTSVKDYEASIRAPLGDTWVPETAHIKLVKPQVVTKLGKIIKPMDEDMIVNKKVKIQGMP